MARYMDLTDYYDILEYIQKGLLVDIQPHKLDLEGGIVALTCGDGDRFHDLYSHKAGIIQTAKANKSDDQTSVDDPRIHMLALNGGALRLLGPDNEIGRPHLNFPGSTLALDLIREINGSLALKKIKQVGLYVHLPCGMAKICNISTWQSLKGLAQAKKIICRPDIKVMTYCHVDYCQFEDGKKKTYFVDTSLIE